MAKVTFTGPIYGFHGQKATFGAQQSSESSQKATINRPIRGFNGQKVTF